MKKDSVTLFNKLKDRREGAVFYCPVVFSGGCTFHQTAKTALIDRGLESASTAAVNIFLSADVGGKTYLPSAEWNALPKEDRFRYWTLQEGDFFRKGVFSSSAVFLTGDQLPECFTLFSFSDDLKGSPSVRHYRLEGKR